MRIRAIQLSWFRGAADPVSLELDSKSVVVYGANGSGKSSFVDAVEYVLTGGRIRHLAHEYSGKRQEKAIPNTHKPEGRAVELEIAFKDESRLKIEINDDGTSTTSGAEAVAMRTWDYRRTVLRQDEVAEFIHDTKGGKYSALLPLLGLRQLELAAVDTRQLARSVEEQSKLREAKATLREVETRRKAAFAADTDEQVLTRIKDLHTRYCADKSSTTDPLARCEELEIALNALIAGSTTDQRRHVALEGAARLDLEAPISAVRSASEKLAGAVEPLIAEKLEVLQSAGEFIDRLANEKEVDCPACGQPVAVATFQKHVGAERERLQEIMEVFYARKAAIGTLCDTLNALKTNLSKADVDSWRDCFAKGPLAGSFDYLNGINADALRSFCTEADLRALEGQVLPLIHAAAANSKDAPPGAQQISTDKQLVETGKAVIAATTLIGEAARAEALLSFIASLEHGIRAEIRLRSQLLIEEISTTMQEMWSILHPGEAIIGVRLYLPDDADKAIDIGLRFHSVEQESPRLTLSEGYRNSLGLCIFLAMAKREAHKDRPLLLDDVVVSLDRNHRGMILELLEREFSDRQVIILTHDRDWYTEMRHQLDDSRWSFKALLPYATPAIGIRWSHQTTTFGDARAQLSERPDSAGTDARKIMDIELALIAERLQIRMPYVRSDKNDKRMAHDFLKRLIADGKICFQKQTGTNYEPHTAALDALDNADRLLLSWANRASHTFDLVRPEAGKLIDTCEAALAFFKCPSCRKPLWYADAGGSDLVQCQCSQIRWRYGKG